MITLEKPQVDDLEFFLRESLPELDAIEIEQDPDGNVVVTATYRRNRGLRTMVLPAGRRL